MCKWSKTNSNKSIIVWNFNNPHIPEKQSYLKKSHKILKILLTEMVLVITGGG